MAWNFVRLCLLSDLWLFALIDLLLYLSGWCGWFWILFALLFVVLFCLVWCWFTWLVWIVFIYFNSVVSFLTWYLVFIGWLVYLVRCGFVVGSLFTWFICVICYCCCLLVLWGVWLLFSDAVVWLIRLLYSVCLLLLVWLLVFRCCFDFYGNGVGYGCSFVLMLVLFDLFAFDVPFHGLLLT